MGCFGCVKLRSITNLNLNAVNAVLVSISSVEKVVNILVLSTVSAMYDDVNTLDSLPARSETTMIISPREPSSGSDADQSLDGDGLALRCPLETLDSTTLQVSFLLPCWLVIEHVGLPPTKTFSDFEHRPNRH